MNFVFLDPYDLYFIMSSTSKRGGILARSTKSQKLGRQLIMGVALGTIPLVGCTPEDYQNALNSTRSDATIGVEQEERALFDRAIETRDVALANEFLEKYPSSKLVRKLLLSLPPETLKRLSRPIVSSVSTRTLESLPNNVRIQLGLVPIESEDRDSPSSGYGG